jgi:hypothetical protein
MAMSLLATIPGEYISRAAQTLPDAADAPDEPHHVHIWYGGRHFRLTFKRFRYKRYKRTSWLWTCEEAALL